MPTNVLLDTSFLLPTLGVEVKADIVKGLKKLADGNINVYFSSFNILECLWVETVLRKHQSFDEGRFREGLRSILDGGVYERAEEGFEAFEKASELRGIGHKDMIDNLLYANSVVNGLRFLTVDADFRSFIREHKLKDTTVFPAEIAMS